MKKFLRVFLTISLCVLLLISVALLIVFITPPKIEFSPKNLINPSDFTSFYDDNNSLMITLNSANKKVENEEYNDLIKRAFISIEDKNFYRHNGLDYKRMLKATLVNLKNFSFKQGASTISQQLIKNTHLSNEKTLSRKINEIKLTRILEKNYSKDEILTMYLNTIYFGENLFGITSAAQNYFGKRPNDLSLSEVATLSGLIASPKEFSPRKNPKASEKRRNTVLNKMYEQGYVTKDEFDLATSYPVKTVNALTDEMYPYLNACIEEIIDKTNLSPYALKNCNVLTYYNVALQKEISSYKTEYDYQAIMINNETCGVSAYYSTVGEIEREIASCGKPLYVYAPAIEENYIGEYTIIKDAPVNYNGYAPKNYCNKYYGNVSIKDAVAKSLNIPAVKVLDSIGIKKAKRYATKLGIKISNDGLSVALGNLGNGIKLKDLASAYTTFANFGNYKKPRFIKKITNRDGKTLYTEDKSTENVFKESTASIITDLLTNTAKKGTAKKLSYLPFQVACKTGTNGSDNGNYDCYSIGYTTKVTAGVWIGKEDYSPLPLTETGSGTATCLLGKYLEFVNEQVEQPDFTLLGIKQALIDKISYENDGAVLIADENTPRRYTLTILVKDESEITEKSYRFSSPSNCDINAEFTDNKVSFTANLPNYVEYELYRSGKNKDELIYSGRENYVDELNESGTFDYYAVYVIHGIETIRTERIKIIGVKFDSVKSEIPKEWWRN